MSQSCTPKDLQAAAACLECLSIPQLEAIQAYLLCQIANGANGSSAKVYRALITQSGGNAPVATVLENTLGGTPVWSFVSPGDYNLTLAGAFPDGKVFMQAQIDQNLKAGTEEFLYPGYSDVNHVQFFVEDSTFTLVGGLGRGYVQILVYP